MKMSESTGTRSLSFTPLPSSLPESDSHHGGGNEKLDSPGMPRKQVKKGNKSVRGGVNALVARIAHATVEGTAFIWTKEGANPMFPHQVNCNLQSTQAIQHGKTQSGKSVINAGYDVLYVTCQNT